MTGNTFLTNGYDSDNSANSDDSYESDNLDGLDNYELDYGIQNSGSANNQNNLNDELDDELSSKSISDYEEIETNNIENLKYTVYLCENEDFANKLSRDESDNYLENYLSRTFLIKSTNNEITHYLNENENIFQIKIYKNNKSLPEEDPQVFFFCGPENHNFINKNKIIWIRNKNNFEILVEYNKCRILGLNANGVVGFYFDDDIMNSIIIKINKTEKYINFGKLNLIENIN